MIERRLNMVRLLDSASKFIVPGIFVPRIVNPTGGK